MNRRIRPLHGILALALAAVGCTANVAGTIDTGTGKRDSVSTKPNGKPATPRPTASASAGAQDPIIPAATATPTSAPSATASATPTPTALTTATPTPVPAVAGADPEAWLTDKGPIVGTAHILAWTRVAPVAGIQLYVDEQRETDENGNTFVKTTAASDPDPAEAKLTLAAPPGAPATTIAAVDVSYEYTTPAQTAEGKPPIFLGPTRVPIAPKLIPAGTATKPGAPTLIDVPLTDRELYNVFAGSYSGMPLQITAKVTFFDDKGSAVPGLDLNPLAAYVPIHGQRGLKPAASAAARQAPALPTLTAATAGAKIVALAGIAPAAGLTLTVVETPETDMFGNTFLTLSFAWGPDAAAPVVYLGAPPGAAKQLIAAYEISYRYTTPARGTQPPLTLGPVVVPIPPTYVGPGALTAITVPVRAAALNAVVSGPLGETPTTIEAVVEFKTATGLPVQDDKLAPLQVVIPIQIK